ncbi:MAG: hypothetical protein VX951_14470 [Planctomycetota bacterium]|nr:hypothetical protein [Planctomycetota bacterium]
MALNPRNAVLGSLVIGGLLGFFARDVFVSPEQGASQLDPDSSMTQEDAGPVASLRSENAALTAKIRDLESELARKPLPKPSSEEPDQDQVAENKASDPVGPTFSSDELSQVLAKIDWSLLGTNMKDLVPLLGKLAEAINKGETPDLNDMAEIQRLNADLLNIAKTISDGKVPGSGINGAFTHPIVVANQLSAALNAAGQALDADQRSALDRVMKEFAARDQNLRLAEADSEFQLENLAQETQLKHEFYTQAKGLLNKDQFGALYNEGSAGRSGLDMFDSGLMLGQYAKPMTATDAKSLAAKTSKAMTSQLGLTGEAAKQLDGIISKWSQSYPSTYWETKADTLEHKGMLKTSRIREALGYHVELTRTILGNITLTPAQRQKLVQGRLILVPLPR